MFVLMNSFSTYLRVGHSVVSCCACKQHCSSSSSGRRKKRACLLQFVKRRPCGDGKGGKAARQIYCFKGCESLANNVSAGV